MTLNEGDWQWRSSSFNFSYFIPKVTGRSGYRSFLTGTCPFVTVRTAGSLAPVLAQHKMWNRYPWGVPVLGWEGWAHGTTPFSPAHRFFQKKRIGTGTWNHALIGGKGWASPSSLHTTLEGPTEYISECNMDGKSTWIPTWHQAGCVSLGLFSKNHLLEVLFSLFSMTHVEWCKVVMLSREYENIKIRSFKICIQQV